MIKHSRYFGILTLFIFWSCTEVVKEKIRISIHNNSEIKVEKTPSVLSSSDPLINYKIVDGSKTILYIYLFYDDQKSHDEEYWHRSFFEFSTDKVLDKKMDLKSGKVNPYMMTGNFDNDIILNPKSGSVILSRKENELFLKVNEDITGTYESHSYTILGMGEYIVEETGSGPE